MKTVTRNYLFLLGGHDLEMVEIEKILIQKKQDYLDKNLSWGAKWSDYSTDIKKPENKGKIFVGIELSGNQDKPSDGIDIDHHNFNSDEVSSIEQVSKLLNVELSHWQQLVAANDRAYIPGLEQMCATKEEIKKIREADKQAQGVIVDDEAKALESVKKHKEVIDGVAIIKALTNKFSPITDLMYGEANQLIVYNDTSLSYYGPVPEPLISHYKCQIKSAKAYYGGNKDNGFFGLAKESWSKDEILEEKETILKIMKNTHVEKLYSYHIFLFPFRWRNWNLKDNPSLEEKFKLETFMDNFLLKSDQCKWKRESFELNHFDHYNEYNYFYEYVREILYDLGNDLKIKKTEDNSHLINHFEYQLPEKSKLFYNIKLKENGKPYHLEIESILLNIYSTGTAVLSFHLRNHLYHNQDDILKINKFGRRLFVPFFDLKPDSIYSGNKDNTNKELLLCSTKDFEIPDAVWIGKKEIPDEKDELFEDFNKYLNKETFKHGPFVLPRFIEGLFPDDFFVTHERKVSEDNTQSQKDTGYKVYLRPVLDDRMFVVSWYGNSQLVEKMNKVADCTDLTIDRHNIYDNRNKKTFYSYETSNWWYSYIYNDTSPMHTNKFQKQELLKNQTYSRWVGMGTLFGISRYSLVMLTADFTSLENYKVTYLVRHLQSMYYKMAELCLLQRATILSFSNEVTAVADLINNEDKTVIDRIESLYKHYLLFVNKIYFREITAQEQGIEMYDMMQSTMRIPQEVKGLDYEIDEINRFASMLHDITEQGEMKKLTIQADKLSKIIVAFLVPTLIIGLLTMKSMPDYIDIPKFLFGGTLAWPFLVSIGIIVIFSCIGYWLIMRYILQNVDSKGKSNFFLSCIGYRFFKRLLHSANPGDKSNKKHKKS